VAVGLVEGLADLIDHRRDAGHPSAISPLAAGVFFITGPPFTSWGARRLLPLRVVITGSVAPTASTIGLASNSPCLP